MKRLTGAYQIKRRFVVSDKAPLDRMVMLERNGTQTLNTVRSWIVTDPLLLYMHVYEPHKHGLTPLQLSRDAVNLLKKELEVNHPEIYTQILIRSKKRLGTK
jgi:hypothetical protein